MPSRNIIKIDVSNSYYHIYARGHGRQAIFQEAEDYPVFLNLFKRHLSLTEIKDNYGKPYVHLRGSIELLCYCLMTNHFHLLVYQMDETAMQRLMRSVMTSYSRYFNKKYNSSGALFESRYKASRISSDQYLLHISRYIHLNPKDWRAYPYSSISVYLDRTRLEWLQNSRILSLFDSVAAYEEFLKDHRDYKASLAYIQFETANNIL